MRHCIHGLSVNPHSGKDLCLVCISPTGGEMTPEQIQSQAYRSGTPCGTCPHCAHFKDDLVRWRECRQDDPLKCVAYIYRHTGGRNGQID